VKLIVGLGNPGRQYAPSRHNIGFLVVKALADGRKAVFKREPGAFSLTAKIKISRQNILLAEPLTFMNLSGEAVVALVNKFKLSLPEILVVCDDLDLEFGSMRLKKSGSSAGHKGIQSITDSLGTHEFARLRIGIGRPQSRIEPAEYVLAPFLKKEKEELAFILGKAVDCCLTWADLAIDKAMNIYNRKE